MCMMLAHIEVEAHRTEFGTACLRLPVFARSGWDHAFQYALEFHERSTRCRVRILRADLQPLCEIWTDDAGILHLTPLSPEWPLARPDSPAP